MSKFSVSTLVKVDETVLVVDVTEIVLVDVV